MSKHNHPSSIESQLNQFGLELGKLEVEIGFLAKQMGSTNPAKPGIFNVKTVVTQNCDQECDLQESKVIESSFVTRLNFLKKAEDNFCLFKESQKSVTPQKPPAHNNHQLFNAKKNEVVICKKKSFERLHQSSPKKHPTFQFPSSPAKKLAKYSGASENYVSTSESQTTCKEPAKFKIDEIESLLERKSTFQCTEVKPRTYPHINLTIRQNSPKKRKVICLGRNYSESKY